MAKGENKIKKSTKGEREHFARHQFRTSAKISHRDAKNFVLFFFCSSYAPDFKFVKLALARIHRAWIDSTNLALKACKNYKISHKMRSEE